MSGHAFASSCIELRGHASLYTPVCVHQAMTCEGFAYRNVELDLTVVVRADRAQRPEERQHPPGARRGRLHRGARTEVPVPCPLVLLCNVVLHGAESLRSCVAAMQQLHLRKSLNYQFFDRRRAGQDVGMARMLTQNVLTSLHGTFGAASLVPSTRPVLALCT